MDIWKRESPLDVYKLLIGAFLSVAPWLFAFGYARARVDAMLSGLLVVAVSFAALYAFADWKEWTALAIGLWVLISPWVLGFPAAAAVKVYVFAGLLIVYLAGLELWLVHYDSHQHPRRR
jgi:ABC-type branched-subunit amino acid transport system permease subunit